MYQSLLFTFLFLNLYNAISQDKSIEFIKLKNTKITSVSSSNVEVYSEAVIYNPLKLKAQIKEMQIDVFVDKKKLGTITDFENVIIKKQQTTNIPLHLRAKTGNVFKNIFYQGSKILTGKLISIEYKGYIKLKAIGGMAPITIKVDGKEHIEFEFILSNK